MHLNRMTYRTLLLPAVFVCAMSVSAQTTRKAPPTPAPAPPTWSLTVYTDKMTDRRRCLISYRKDSNVWYTTGDVLIVSYDHRGGVSSFQYRIDKEAASELKVFPRNDNDYITISGYGGRLSPAKNLSFRG